MVNHFLVDISYLLQQFKRSGDIISIVITKDCGNIPKKFAELEEISEICFSTN